jgi:hypothetical protein
LKLPPPPPFPNPAAGAADPPKPPDPWWPNWSHVLVAFAFGGLTAWLLGLQVKEWRRPAGNRLPANV